MADGSTEVRLDQKNILLNLVTDYFMQLLAS